MSIVMKRLETRPFAIIGHRGASMHAPENTLLSFRRAIELGADIVECDVRLTGDGVPVVYHDETLSRLVGVDKRISELSYKELLEYRVGGEGIPRLDEVLDLVVDKAGLFIEIKAGGAEEGVVEVVRERGAEKWTAIVSFSQNSIERAKRLAPSIPTGLIYARPASALTACKQLKCRIVLPHYRLVTRRMVDFAHKLGVKVVAWTINSIEMAKRVYESTVDGIATDDPQVMAAFRKRLLEAGG